MVFGFKVGKRLFRVLNAYIFSFCEKIKDYQEDF